MNTSKQNIRRQQNEGGSALVAALCLIFMGGMLTGAVLMLSRIATYDVRAHVELQRSAYINEGTANRIQWLLAADRHVYTASVLLGELDYTEYDHDRYAADGIPHIVNYHGTEVKVSLFDAVSGFDLSANRYRSTFQRIVSVLELEDSQIQDTTDTLAARIQDYIDTDDNAGDDNGMESPEYETENLQPLPRNSSMYFREEFAFIPGIIDFFKPDSYGILSEIRILPPEGMNPSGNNTWITSSPSIMTATPQMLKIIGNLEDTEVDEVIEARNLWFKEKTPLSEQLDAALLATLRSRFSFYESGCFTIRIEAPEKSKRPSKVLHFSFISFDIGGPTNQMVRYYDWFMP